MSPLPLCKLFHADHLETPTVSKCPAVVSPSHGTLSIVVDELAKNPSLRLVRELAEVHPTLRVTFPGENTSVACTEGNHMSWSGEVICGNGG